MYSCQMSSHEIFLTKEVGRSLNSSINTDLQIICRSDIFFAHQSILGSVSPLLTGLIGQLNCCSCQGHLCGRKETLQVHLPNLQSQTVKDILCLLYEGSVELPAQERVDDIQEGLNMLQIKIETGMEWKVSSDDGLFANFTSEIRNMEGEAAPAIQENESKAVIKRKSVDDFSWNSPSENKYTKIFDNGELDKVTSTTKLQPNMANEVKEVQEVSRSNKVLGIAQQISMQNISSHFEQHLQEKQKSSYDPDASATHFPCPFCGIKFKYRRGIDTHVAKKHPKEHNNQGDVISDVDSKRCDLVKQTYVLKKVKGINEITEGDPIKSSPVDEVQKTTSCHDMQEWGNETVESALHIDEIDIEIDQIEKNIFKDKQLQTKGTNSNDQKQNTAGLNSESQNSLIMVNRKSDNCGSESHVKTNDCPEFLKTKKAEFKNNNRRASYSDCREEKQKSKEWFCQMCLTSGFYEFSKFKTHYTKEHFWSDLSTEYKSWKNKCEICSTIYPTSDHLLQHMGNFHCSVTVDKYLKAKGLKTISHLSTIRVLSESCKICCATQMSSYELKSHLATKHFNDHLKKEFITEKTQFKKCPICGKNFGKVPNNINIVRHVGSFHNEVLKYAMEHIEIEAEDKCYIPVNDFDDYHKDVQNNVKEDNVPNKKSNKESKPKSTKCNANYDSRPKMINHYSSHVENKLEFKLKTQSIELTTKSINKSSETDKRENCENVFVDLICQLCKYKAASKTGLKKHYVISHFKQNIQQKIKELNKVGEICPYCEKSFTKDVNLYHHISMFHSDIVINMIHDNEKVKGQNEHANKETKLEEKLQMRVNFDCKICQKCGNKYSMVQLLKDHYATHYKTQLLDLCPSERCTYCSMSFPNIHSTHRHIFSVHTEVLAKLMNEDGLALNLPSATESEKKDSKSDFAEQISPKMRIQSDYGMFNLRDSNFEELEASSAFGEILPPQEVVRNVVDNIIYNLFTEDCMKKEKDDDIDYDSDDTIVWDKSENDL